MSPPQRQLVALMLNNNSTPLLGNGSPWEREIKSRTFADFTLEPDLPSVQLDELFRQCKSLGTYVHMFPSFSDWYSHSSLSMRV
jgi:hypothetical protein